MSLLLVLLDRIVLAGARGHLQGFLKGVRVYFLEDGLEGNERLLEYLVPVVVSEVYDDGDEHGESSVLVGLEDVQEVVILEEAHGSVSYLQVDSANALHNSLEETGDESLNFVDFTDFEDLLEFSKEEGLFDAVSEWPVSEEAFE